MQVDWHGQSAFTLAGDAATVFIDPWGDMSGAAARGIEWGYPPIEAPAAVDLLIVTHEHGDHNAVEVIAGEPALVRSVAGTHETPLGEVLAIASEHDGAAGTERGPNTIVVFTLDGLRVAHFGDFGQPALRPEQRAHLDGIDLLFLPVGGGPTIDGAAAATIAKELAPSWVVPMHYRTAPRQLPRDRGGVPRGPAEGRAPLVTVLRHGGPGTRPRAPGGHPRRPLIRVQLFLIPGSPA